MTDETTNVIVLADVIALRRQERLEAVRQQRAGRDALRRLMTLPEAK